MSALNPSMRIGEQLAEVPIYHAGASRAEANARARQLLADVNLPDPDRIMAAYPHQLSGGQQQRVVIAMALLANPALLLLDEPTTGLDVTVEAGVVELIASLRQRFGTSLLYISHNLGLIAQVCDRVAVMYSGQIVESGTIEEVFAAPKHPYTRGLFGCIPLPTADKTARPLMPIRGQVTLPSERPQGCYFGPRCDSFSTGVCDAGRIPLESVDSRHAVRCARWRELERRLADVGGEHRQPVSEAEIVLAIRNLSKHYDVRESSIGALVSGQGSRTVKANEALSFRARQGQTLAIVGESGCGKSTFAKVLMGLETASEGVIDFAGTDLAQLPVGKRTAGQLGSLQMVFQNPDETLNPSFSVGSQIARVIRKIAGVKDGKQIEAQVARLFEQVKLPHAFAGRRPRQLSGGQKQRVGIARAFAGNPRLVVADEPVSALDVSVQAAVTELLMDIQKRHGTTLLFISHDLSLVRYLADRVVVMYLGQIMEVGTTQEVFAPPYHPYTEALLSAVPVADPSIRQSRIVLEGELPSALNPPKGCPFHTRCHRKLGQICEQERPAEQRTPSGHRIACHIPMAELARIAPVFAQNPRPEAARPAASGEG
jgi:peptide/nickel transport system ATP-binding protein